jgi:hypothetical protein
MTVAPVAMYNTASVFAARGQKDSAFYWLDQLVTRASYTNAKAVARGQRLRIASERSAIRDGARTHAQRPASVHDPEGITDVRLLGRRLGRSKRSGAAGRPELRPIAARRVCAVRELGRRPGRRWEESQQLQQETKQWQQFWTDQYGHVTEYRESEWINGSLRYSAKQQLPRPALLHMTFTPVNPDLVRQFGESSIDGGKTWTPTFDLYYHRKK